MVYIVLEWNLLLRHAEKSQLRSTTRKTSECAYRQEGNLMQETFPFPLKRDKPSKPMPKERMQQVRPKSWFPM